MAGSPVAVIYSDVLDRMLARLYPAGYRSSPGERSELAYEANLAASRAEFAGVCKFQTGDWPVKLVHLLAAAVEESEADRVALAAEVQRLREENERLARERGPIADPGS